MNMDEITIDDKKYISSKRAAKITGYAKDYVGQLCREGYVEARRVGRNWYVLESAIRDHRFGTTVTVEPTQTPATPTKPAGSTSKPLLKAWDAPKYEAIKTEELPSINRLRRPEATETQQDFHEAWQTWFDTFRAGEGHQEHNEHPQGLVLMPTDEVMHGEPKLPQVEEVPVPVRLLTIEEAKPSLSHIAPSATIIETRIEDAMSHKTGHPEQILATGGTSRSLGLALLIIVSLFCVAIAALGTGYFDKNTISYKQVQIISGISIYNKN